jgi:hypothetical protein
MLLVAYWDVIISHFWKREIIVRLQADTRNKQINEPSHCFWLKKTFHTIPARKGPRWILYIFKVETPLGENSENLLPTGFQIRLLDVPLWPVLLLRERGSSQVVGSLSSIFVGSEFLKSSPMRASTLMKIQQASLPTGQTRHLQIVK